MLWVRPSRNSSELGYLYLRKTVYLRPAVTLLDFNGKKGESRETRGKYSKKRDIYCGKIVQVSMKSFDNFESYIEGKGISFLEYKLNATFEQILKDFTHYLCSIHQITLSDIENNAYVVGSGYLCKETIDFVSEFKPRSIYGNMTDIKNFAFRCEDAGIYDENIIMLLYAKLFPQTLVEEKTGRMPDSVSAKNMREFLQKSRDLEE
jgi:hypothetical protein